MFGGVYGGGGAGFFDALNNKPLPRLYSFGDYVILTDALAERYTAEGYLVVRTDDVDNLRTLNFRDCLLGHEQGIFRHGSRHANTAELPRPQQGLRIGKLGDKTQCAGLEV